MKHQGATRQIFCKRTRHILRVVLFSFYLSRHCVLSWRDEMSKMPKHDKNNFSVLLCVSIFATKIRKQQLFVLRGEEEKGRKTFVSSCGGTKMQEHVKRRHALDLSHFPPAKRRHESNSFNVAGQKVKDRKHTKVDLIKKKWRRKQDA